MRNVEPGWEDRREPVRLEGRLTDLQTVQADNVAGLTATLREERASYGGACHVTFSSRRDLDLWVAAVVEAWEEAQTVREGLASELPDWMRPAQERLRKDLMAVVRGQLRCGKPIRPTGVRPATVLAERVQFPGLDPEVLCRAETIWRRACEARHGVAAPPQRP